MHRKDYIKAAKIVKDMRDRANDPNRILGSTQKLYELTAATEASYAFIEFFKGDNPRFDEVKFLAACNPKEV